MKISEIEKILTDAKKEYGDIPVRVWFWHPEDDLTLQVNNCFLGDFNVTYYQENNIIYKDEPCVILELNGADDRESKVFDFINK